MGGDIPVRRVPVRFVGKHRQSGAETFCDSSMTFR
jgi:hypothetical protein